jgi:hypothetical protein
MNSDYDTPEQAEAAAKAYAEANGGVVTAAIVASIGIEQNSNGKFYAVARAY